MGIDAAKHARLAPEAHNAHPHGAIPRGILPAMLPPDMQPAVNSAEGEALRARAARMLHNADGKGEKPPVTPSNGTTHLATPEGDGAKNRAAALAAMALAPEPKPQPLSPEALAKREKLNDMPAPKGPGMIMRGAHWVNGKVSGMLGIGFMSAMGGGLIAGVGSMLPWWAGNKPISAIGKTLAYPGKLLNESKVSDAGNIVSGGIGKVNEGAKYLLGEESAVVAKLAGAQASVRGGEAKLGMHVANGLNKASTGLGNMVRSIFGGQLQSIGNWYEKGAVAKKQAATKGLNDLMEALKHEKYSGVRGSIEAIQGVVGGAQTAQTAEQLVKAGGELAQNVSTLSNAANALERGQSALAGLSGLAGEATPGFFGAVRASGHVRELGEVTKVFQKGGFEHFAELGEEMGKLQTLIGHDVSKVKDMGAVKTALGKVTELMGRAVETHGDMGTVALNTRKQTALALTQIERAERGMARATGWRNLPESIAKLPTTLGNVNMMHAAGTAAMAGGTALHAHSTIQSMRDQIGVLRHMYADMTGQKVESVSTRQVLFGKVPPMIQQARKQILTQFGPKMLIDGINGFLTYRMMRNVGGMKDFGASMVLMAGDMMHSSLTANDKVIPLYQQFVMAYQKGDPIPKEHYAQFIFVASKDARHTEGPQNRLIMALANDYAEKQASPAQVLREIESGVFNARANELAKGFKDQAAAKPSPIVDATGKDKTVLGKHTARATQMPGANPVMAV